VEVKITKTGRYYYRQSIFRETDAKTVCTTSSLIEAIMLIMIFCRYLSALIICGSD